MKIAVAQELGSLGPSEGQTVVVDCPIWDSLRGAYVWLLLLALLLLRKPNRTAGAWLILAPLLAVHLLVSTAQSRLSAFFVYDLHQSLCFVIGDLLKFFAQSVAVVLAVSDLFRVKGRLLRLMLAFLTLFLVSGIAVTSNAWPVLSPHAWESFFVVFLFVFTTGHSLVVSLLRRIADRQRFRRLHAGFCLVFGLCPLLILGAVQAALRQSAQPHSQFEFYRAAITLAAAICLPYFVFFWFALLGAASPFYRQRLAQGFGVDASPTAPLRSPSQPDA